MKFLMSSEVKNAESRCRDLKTKQSNSWVEEDREALTTLCNALDVAGIFIRAGFPMKG
jgi:post-segregation antitoxin (ccd killing protein)